MAGKITDQTRPSKLQMCFGRLSKHNETDKIPDGATWRGNHVEEAHTVTQVSPPSGGAGEGSSQVSMPRPGAASRAETVQFIADLHTTSGCACPIIICSRCLAYWKLHH